MKFLFKHNWFAIVYFNLKMLPLKQAIKFPFDFSYGNRFINLTGKIEFICPVRFGMIKIGGRGSDMFSKESTILDIKGRWILGQGIQIGNGSLIKIEDNAILKFGNDCRIGARSKIFCSNYISLGNQIDISWESQVFDTNFHYMQDLSSQKVIRPKGEIRIGNNCWIGNRVNIMKGAVIPDDVIVASNSLINKDLSDTPANSMLAGSPVRLVKQNIRRLFEGVDDNLINEND